MTPICLNIKRMVFMHTKHAQRDVSHFRNGEKRAGSPSCYRAICDYENEDNAGDRGEDGNTVGPVNIAEVLMVGNLAPSLPPAFQLELTHLLRASSTLNSGFCKGLNILFFCFKDEKLYSQSSVSSWLVSFILFYGRRPLNIFLILKLPLRTLPNHLMKHKI